jgi:hypothetical protein
MVMPDSFFKKGIFSWLLIILYSFSFAQVAVPVEETENNNSTSVRQLPTANPAFAKASAGRSRQSLSDSALLDLVQKQTFKYFWDFADPVSGLARERSNVTPAYGNEVVTIGGSGFGVMAIIVATERHWIRRDTAVKHLLKSVKFLS